MWKGTVDSIHIAPAAAAPTQAVDQAEAVPGSGLVGDRYFLKQGTFFKPEPAFELTLIEDEAIEAAQREYQVKLAVGEARRNVVTRDARNVPRRIRPAWRTLDNSSLNAASFIPARFERVATAP